MESFSFLVSMSKMELVMTTNSIHSAVRAVRERQGEERGLERVSKEIDRWRSIALWLFLATVAMSTERRYNADGWLDDLRPFKRCHIRMR